MVIQIKAVIDSLKHLWNKKKRMACKGYFFLFLTLVFTSLP